ncbi:MAG: hypothetical protein KAH95_01220, partial [Spirochaetales bacterium]|nr:hypothetical protein [Spirochaetales bacterium]
MKKVLYDQTDYYCSLASDFNFSEIKYEHWSEYKFSENKKISKYIINIEGENWEILWPNREGEIFSASSVYEKIKEYNVPNGLTLTYPSTASCRTLIFLEESGEGLALMSPPDKNGRVTEFRINAESSKNVSININGENSKWYLLSFKSLHELEEKVKKLQNTIPWPGLDEVQTDSKWQVQVGLIGPDGKTEVNKNKGFNVLVDISEVMQKELGENNILHIFGYSYGHDMDYPNYTPSSQLGGISRLQKAIEKVHQNNQKVVFYMNGRIAQKEN